MREGRRHYECSPQASTKPVLISTAAAPRTQKEEEEEMGIAAGTGQSSDRKWKLNAHNGARDDEEQIKPFLFFFFWRFTTLHHNFKFECPFQALCNVPLKEMVDDDDDDNDDLAFFF